MRLTEKEHRIADARQLVFKHSPELLTNNDVFRVLLENGMMGDMDFLKDVQESIRDIHEHLPMDSHLVAYKLEDNDSSVWAHNATPLDVVKHLKTLPATSYFHSENPLYRDEKVAYIEKLLYDGAWSSNERMQATIIAHLAAYHDQCDEHARHQPGRGGIDNSWTALEKTGDKQTPPEYANKSFRLAALYVLQTNNITTVDNGVALLDKQFGSEASSKIRNANSDLFLTYAVMTDQLQIGALISADDASPARLETLKVKRELLNIDPDQMHDIVCGRHNNRNKEINYLYEDRMWETTNKVMHSLLDKGKWNIVRKELPEAFFKEDFTLPNPPAKQPEMAY